MKKYILSLALVTALTAVSALAARPHMGGGFTGPGAESATVADALKMRDDTPVTLRGTIEKRLGGEHYLFKDATGTITVEIDDDKWNGQNVTPDTPIEISGEIDKDWTSLKVDVDVVRLIPGN